MGVAGRKVSGPFFFAQRPLMPVLCGRARIGVRGWGWVTK
jgi:hypothetical protein